MPYRPVLLMIVPADWDAVPEALTELRRCLGEEYGGSLMLRQAGKPLRSPLIHYCGYWELDVLPFARRDLGPRAAAAFVDLSWADLEDAG